MGAARSRAASARGSSTPSTRSTASTTTCCGRDIDGDGERELVTGKRYRAHCGNDPGEYDPVGIYYFKWTGEGFAKQVIDYGPTRVANGCGIYFQVVDIDGDGRLDIVAPGKDGLYLFRNLGSPSRWATETTDTDNWTQIRADSHR